MTPVSPAPLSYYHDFGQPPSGYCMRADPVHLRADTSGLILFDLVKSGVTEQELFDLATDISEHLAQDGFRLECRAGERWYLTGDTSQDVHADALSDAVGRILRPTHLQGHDAQQWTRRLNEIQMLLSAHPVNRQRLAEGKVAINSLWLWGGGCWLAPLVSDCTGMTSDNPCVCGYAGASGMSLRQWDNGRELADVHQAGERQLVVYEACRRAAAYQDISDWSSALQMLEHGWLLPLTRALARGRFSELELFPLNGFSYRIRRRDMLRFWQRGADYRFTAW